MPYIGKPASVNFTETVKDSFDGDNSTVAFTMSQSVSLDTDIEVFVENVQQEPGSGKAYTVSGTTLTFSTAPPTGTANIYVIHRNSLQGTLLPPANLGDRNYSVSGTITANGGAVFNDDSADKDFRVESNGNTHMLFVDGGNDKVMIGLETPETFNGTTPPLQIEGTDNNSGSLSITRNSNDNGQPLLIFSKSRGTAVNSDTIVQDNDVIGQIVFLGADGTDRNSQAATIEAVINGTPGSDDMPGELIFRTTTDGTASATERMKIDAVGDVTISTGDIIFGTSAKGINLGVTANTDSNTLDDYEEGTFSMSENNGTGVGVTQDDTQYTKIGRLVVLYADYAIGSNSASGVVSFSSVPFTASSDLSQKADTFTSATTDPIMFVLGANLNSVKANATANLVYSELSGKFIRVNLQYQLASG